MRLFVALDIPAEIRERIAQFIERLRRHAPHPRWVKTESLHVTLKFLGEVPESRLSVVQEALRQVKGEPFPVSFKDTGFFPAPRSPRVFWVGVKAEADLSALANAIDKVLQLAGFEPEQREFSPHLTVARKSESKKLGGGDAGFSALHKILAEESSIDFGTMTAEDFFLFQSRLSPQGAAYTKLMRFPLRPAD